MMPLTNRSYVSGHSVLNLAGVDAGIVRSVRGGGVFAEVISQPPGSENYRRKHIGVPQVEAFTIQVDFSMSQVLYDWIASSWQASHQRMNGAVIAYDYNWVARNQRQFADALLSEVTIPTLDAASKDPAYLTIKIQPETIQYMQASGGVPSNPSAKAQGKAWAAHTFQLVIDGLDCSRVSRVDTFTVKLETTTDQIGDARAYQNEPSVVDFPNLRITFSESSAQSWIDWHDRFVVKGDNGEKQEKNGALIFKSANMATELGRIDFFNLGIFRLGLDDDESTGEKIQRATAELYCERMQFQYGGLQRDESGGRGKS